MLKTLTLWWIFIKKNIVPMLITLLLLTIALFILVSSYGQYRYVAYTRDIMSNSKLQNGGHYMLNYDDELIGEIEQMESIALSVRKQIVEHPACKYILTTDSFSAYEPGDEDPDVYRCFLYDEQTIADFPLFVDEGRWLNSETTQPETVICGNSSGKKLGEILHLDCGIEAKIVGIINDVPLYPAFNRFSNSSFPASNLFKNGSMILFINRDMIPDAVLNDIRYNDRTGNCYVVFEENATDSERADLLGIMESYGLFVPYEKIITDSNEQIDKWLYQVLPLPLFLIAVCTISIICICIVIIKRSMSEYSKYYLMGCTKKKSVFLVTAPMAIMFTLPCFLNLLSVLVFPHFLRAGNRYPAGVDYILDYRAVLLIIAFAVVIILPIIVMPKIFYRNYSPLSLYRRNM